MKFKIIMLAALALIAVPVMAIDQDTVNKLSVLYAKYAEACSTQKDLAQKDCRAWVYLTGNFESRIDARRDTEPELFAAFDKCIEKRRQALEAEIKAAGGTVTP